MNEIIARARKLRRMIEQNAQGMPDETAQHYAELFHHWKEGDVYAEEDVGKRIYRKGKLYKVRCAHTAQIDWPPEYTPSLYEEISIDPEAGTEENPIEYSGNMTLEKGNYYVEDGAVYLCTRDSEIPVYNTLAELVGLYVEKVQ